MNQTAPSKKPVLTPEILVPRLGDYLVERGLITTEQLQTALQHQAVLRKTREDAPRLGELLVELGMITRAELEQAITEHVLQLRNALQETNRQLEQRVRERTAELEKALEKLSELSQLKANFIANISHELRTPLTHIRGYQELLLSGDLGELTSEQITALRTMQRSTDRLERLIEDLILFATAERTHLPIQWLPLDLRSLAERSSTRFFPKPRIIITRLNCTPPTKYRLSMVMRKNSVGYFINCWITPLNLPLPTEKSPSNSSPMIYMWWSGCPIPVLAFHPTG